MRREEKDIDLEEILTYIWLFFVALFGAVTGFFTKLKKDTVPTRQYCLLGIATSMFISYITYETSMYFFKANGLSVALAGLASFTGTDLAVTIERAFIEMIERKFRSL